MSKKSDTTLDPEFEKISQYFLKQEDVSIGKMFGASGLKVGPKVFAMLVKGELVVKLPAEVVDEQIKNKLGKRFDPGHGKLMKEWLSVDKKHSTKWLALAKQSFEFVSNLAK